MTCFTTRTFSTPISATLAPSRTPPERPSYGWPTPTCYSVKTIPGVRKGIEQKQYTEAEAEIVRAAKALDQETMLINAAAADLERLRK
jgi:hypothetical protein